MHCRSVQIVQGHHFSEHDENARVSSRSVGNLKSKYNVYWT